jgi:hypothetical protein
VNKSAPIIRDVVVRAASMQQNVGRLVFVASTAQLVSFIAETNCLGVNQYAK